MGYYEHEIKVKAMDNILSRSQDWGWFVEYTEKHFSPNIEASSFDDVLLIFRDIQPVFEFLCRIHEISDCDFPIKSNWLKELEQLSYYYNGQRDLSSLTIQTTFSRILLILIYAGKIYGQIKNDQYFIYTPIFKFRNIHTLENIELFIDEESTFDSLFNAVDIDIGKEIECFKDNINKNMVPVSSAFIAKHKDNFLCGNCLSFCNTTSEDTTTWEEKEILNMLLTSYSDGNLIPQWSLGTHTYPDMSIWTEDVLEYLINYFNDDSVTFVVESIRFAIHGTQPSKRTINLHFTLLDELYQTITEKGSDDFNCSSLEFILSFFDKKYNRDKCFEATSFKAWENALIKLYDFKMFDMLFKIKDHNAIPNKTINQKLKDILINRSKSIDSITQEYDFMEYIQDDRLRSLIDNSLLVKASEKFDQIVSGDDVRNVAIIFIKYFKFLLKIKNNKNINSNEVSSEIIRIRALWQTEHYKKAAGSLSRIRSDSFTISKDAVDAQIHLMLYNPFKYVSDICKLNSDRLIASISNISMYPLSTLVSKVFISEDFPYEERLKLDEKHPIDLLFLEEVKKVIEEKGYKLINSFKPYEYINTLYQRIIEDIRFRMHLLNNVELLYDAVVAQNIEYQFVEYSPEPLLAHITQLFPVLENKIRLLGEMLNIVPVCEKEELSNRLKEPHSILNTILKEVADLTGSIVNASDLFFVNFCMFGENGLNIRNDCIHGNYYNSKESFDFAFKVSLLCLYLIGFRCEIISENIKNGKAKQR